MSARSWRRHLLRGGGVLFVALGLSADPTNGRAINDGDVDIWVRETETGLAIGRSDRRTGAMGWAVRTADIDVSVDGQVWCHLLGPRCLQGLPVWPADIVGATALWPAAAPPAWYRASPAGVGATRWDREGRTQVFLCDLEISWNGRTWYRLVGPNADDPHPLRLLPSPPRGHAHDRTPTPPVHPSCGQDAYDDRVAGQ